MGIKDLLFGKNKKKAAHKYPPDIRHDLMEAIETAISGILSMNFSLMGVEAQHVPTTGSTGSLRSRGYLIGLSDAMVQQFSDLNPTQKERLNALCYAFVMTYGPIDWKWALESEDSLRAGEPDATDGAKLAHRDVEAIYSGQLCPSPTGFWLLNNGDEEAISYNLTVL